MPERLTYPGVSLSSGAVTHQHTYEAAGNAQGIIKSFYAVGMLRRGLSLWQALRIWRTFVRTLWEYGISLTPTTRTVVAAAGKAEQVF